MPRSLALLVVAALSLARAERARLAVLPRFAARISQPSSQRDGGASDYAVVTALGGADPRLLNGMFGTCFPLDDGVAAGLHADLCAPLLEGAPSLVVLASIGAAPAPLAALAVADVWVAALPHGGGESAGVDALLERAMDALDALPPPPPRAPPHQLLVLAHPTANAAALEARMATLWAERRGAERGAAAALLAISVGPLPQGADDGAEGRELLACFGQPSSSQYLLGEARRVPPSVGLAALPALLGALLEGGVATRGAAGGAGALLPADDFAALTGCARAREAAWASASRAVAALADEQAEATLNPLEGFAARAQAVHDDALDAYGGAAAAWAGGAAHAAAAERLRRDVLSSLLRRTRSQVGMLRAEAHASFTAELAVLMATSASYGRASSNLRKRALRAFDRAAKAAVPPAAASHSAALRAAAGRALQRAMAAEAEEHEGEAAELPPREQDVGDPPWWKQILIQALSMGLNLGQAYFLQHLPARRRDLADERALPRGPLF